MPVFAPSDKLPSSSEAAPGCVGVGEAETDGGTGYGLGCRPRANDIGAGGAIQRGADAGRVVKVTTTVGSIAERKTTGITDVTKMEPATWHRGRVIALAIPVSIQILVRLGQAAGWGSESSRKWANA